MLRPVSAPRALSAEFDDDGSPYDEIIATYDPTLGFPTLIEYRAKPNIADGGMIHYLRNVQPLE